MYDLIEQYLQFQKLTTINTDYYSDFVGIFKKVNAYVEGKTAVEIKNNWWHKNCWFYVYLWTKIIEVNCSFPV